MEDPICIFKRSIVGQIFTPKVKLTAALEACHGTIRFVEDYPPFEACYPKRHGSSVVYIHEIYAKFAPQGEIGIVYATVDGRMEIGNIADLEQLNCYEPLIDYAVKVALNLDHTTLNGVRKPSVKEVINYALAIHITSRLSLDTLLMSYYSEKEIVDFVDSVDFKQLIDSCREEVCSEEASENYGGEDED